MEPIPPAAPPHQGPSSHPLSSTKQSPRFTKPFMGEGICTTIVATQVSAASTAAITIVLIFLSDMVLHLTKFVPRRTKKSLQSRYSCIIVRTGIIKISILIFLVNTRWRMIC